MTNLITEKSEANTETDSHHNSSLDIPLMIHAHGVCAYFLYCFGDRQRVELKFMMTLMRDYNPFFKRRVEKGTGSSLLSAPLVYSHSCLLYTSDAADD